MMGKLEHNHLRGEGLAITILFAVNEMPLPRTRNTITEFLAQHSKRRLNKKERAALGERVRNATDRLCRDKRLAREGQVNEVKHIIYHYSPWGSQD